MKVALENGKLCLRQETGELFACGLSASVNFNGEYRNTLHLLPQGEWRIDENKAYCDNVTMEFRHEGNGVLVKTVFTNTFEDIAVVNSFDALCFETAEIPEKALVTRPHKVNGNQHGGMQAHCETVSLLFGTHETSADFVAVECEKQNCIFGFAGFERFFSLVEIAGDGTVTMQQLTEKHPLINGGKLESDWMYLTPCGEITEALPRYGELLKKTAGCEQLRHGIPAGYCSWYYYLGEVKAEDILENSHWFCDHKEYPIKYIQVDAGWHGEWGDWLPNEKFHYDMKVTAEKIKADGFIPGLWFCPFGVSENSEVAQNHPEYFVKKKDGSLWKAGGRFCFDFSQNEVCEYMKNTVTRFTKEWGYGYLKLDIISDVLSAGVYHDPSFNSLMNYRKGLEIVKKAAGENTFILGCTTPLLPSVGLVDGMRVSGDIFDHWECLPRIFARVIKRWWMHGTLYWNDADCLLVRTLSEEDEQCRRPCSRTKTEIETFVTAMVASGGALMLSDKMSLLKDWQKDLLSLCFPLNEMPAVPLDLMINNRPSVLDFGVRNGARTVAVINWEERAHSFIVPFTEGRMVFEFWQKEFLGFQKENLQVTVEPHTSRVYQITEEKECGVVGRSASLILDIIEEDGEYQGRKANEKIFIAEKKEGGYSLRLA